MSRLLAVTPAGRELLTLLLVKVCVRGSSAKKRYCPQEAPRKGNRKEKDFNLLVVANESGAERITDTDRLTDNSNNIIIIIS